MAQFKDYEDEIRDFSLLVTNQFILAMVMMELPIKDYKVEVYTEELTTKFKLAAFAEIRFLVANKDIYKLELKILEDEGDDFKFVAMLKYPKPIIVSEGTLTEEDIDKFLTDKSVATIVPFDMEEKIFFFRPTMNQGEVIVNELSIWLKEQIALKVSGLN